MSISISPPQGDWYCSPEMQDDRLKLLRGLLAKKYSGVKSIGDRGRSVTYQDRADLQKSINDLQDAIDYCNGVRRLSKPRLFVVPYNKWD